MLFVSIYAWLKILTDKGYAATNSRTQCPNMSATTCRYMQARQQEEQQLEQRPASISKKRDPLQHMHFNSLFNGLGSQEDEERVYNGSEKHCTSAQKLQRMPAAGLKLQ